jgi:polysaccharide export outer membrane protein
MKISSLALGIALLIGMSAEVFAEPPAQGEPVAVPTDYRVGAGDVLEVSVWKEESLTKQVLVRPDGGITFPLIGDLPVAGRSVEEIKADVGKRLAEFIAEPEVNVSVINVNQKIYVLGRVNKPGEFVTPNRVDVMQALAMAGGLTPFADDDDIRIIRRGEGEEVSFSFDYDEVSGGDSLEQNILLQRGDVIVVP